MKRLFWVWLYRIWPGCVATLAAFQPDTLIRWHRRGFRLYWTWKSRRRRHTGRPATPPDIRILIRQLSRENPLWGAPHVHGEMFRRRVKSLGMEEVLTAPRSPWQNPYLERLIGSIRRDCLDHHIILDEGHLNRVLRAYMTAR